MFMDKILDLYVYNWDLYSMVQWSCFVTKPNFESALQIEHVDM